MLVVTSSLALRARVMRSLVRTVQLSMPELSNVRRQLPNHPLDTKKLVTTKISCTLLLFTEFLSCFNAHQPKDERNSKEANRRPNPDVVPSRGNLECENLT